MIWVQSAVVVLALFTLVNYAHRINDVSFRTHRTACVLAQLAGGLTACAVFGWAFLTGPAELVLCGVALALCWTHLLGTAPDWRHGAPAKDTRPGIVTKRTA